MEKYLQHFRKEEQPFIEKVIGWKREVERRYSLKRTDFLDPREQFIVKSIIGSEEFSVQSHGAFSNAERRRIIICPTYYSIKKEDFQISVFSVHYPSKFIELRHQDILGALLSLGLERDKFGDICVSEKTIQFAISKEVSDYVLVHLKAIGKVKVELEEVSEENIMQIEERWTETSMTVSSMRLDNILASVLNMSRAKAQALIQAGKVKVNHAVCDEKSFEIEQGDLLSVRGYGRMKIISIEGRTNKDKIRIKVGKIL